MWPRVVADVYIRTEVDPPVLAECTIHGSFVVLASEVGAPCQRCRTGRKPERFEDGDPDIRALHRKYGRRHFERSGAAILQDVRNREVGRTELAVDLGIEAGLAWCEGSERQ